MVLVLLLIPWGRTSGGHGLLEAVPRIYQVTPDIPDRRRATQQDGSQTTDLADSLKESQLAARSGPSPPRRTSPTTRITTASLEGALPAVAALLRRLSVDVRGNHGASRPPPWIPGEHVSAPTASAAASAFRDRTRTSAPRLTLQLALEEDG